MCGINGTIGNNENWVRVMNKAIHYRGPDDTGVYATSSFTIGNNRLAIIDLSPLGHQPMVTIDSRFSIAFNGEIYNFKEIRRELETNGVRFKSNSDTEVVLEGFALWGADIVSKLRGMWAFAILDSKKNSLFLSRDPFGIKPLYIYDDGITLAFSSEIRGLLSHPHVKKVADHDSVREIILLGHTIAPRTILKNASALLPGEEISIDLGSRKLERRLRAIETFEKSPPSDQTLEDIIKESLSAHLLSDVPVGLFFSGGTDSTLLAALLQSMGTTLTAYHLSISGRDDTTYAEKIAAKLGLSLVTIPFSEKTVFARADEALNTLDLPIADTSFLPTFFIAEEARKGVKVVLSGEGGDELFGGYKFHESLSKLPLSSKEFSTSFNNLIRIHPSIIKYYPALQGLIRKHATITNNSLERYLGERAFGLPLHALHTAQKAIAKRVSNDPHPDAVLAFDRLIYLPDNNLLKIDTATMGNSIEGRVPLLDRSIWQQVGGAPLSWKHADGIGKAPLKRILEKYLPKELVHRSKTGFSFPLKSYLAADNGSHLTEAIEWYQKALPGLIPALDSALKWGVPNHRDVLLSRIGYSVYAIVVLHHWFNNHRLSL